MLKAFVLCDNIADNPTSAEQKDLQGAGLSRIKCVGPLPVKLSFWVFVQLSDQKETGEARLALMRADSGRRYFFRPITIRHSDTVQATVFCIRVYDCVFPERGVYFVELWYDNVWVVDQRLELTYRETAVGKTENQDSGPSGIQVFELTMDNAEDQDALNRHLRKPGESSCTPIAPGESTKRAERESIQGIGAESPASVERPRE